MNQTLFFLLWGWMLFSGCSQPVEEPIAQETMPAVYEHYTLVWNDEFDGTSLDGSRWTIETGTGVNGDFGTGQLDRATNRKENVSLESNVEQASGGCLVLTTRKEHYIDREYTSGRILTRDKGSWGPGHRIEARIKPSGVRYKGQGFAFWMMPSEIPPGEPHLMWPQGGEIDIMEYVGSFPFHNLGSVHYAWWWRKNEWSEGNHGHQGSYYTYFSRDVPLSAPAYNEYVPPSGDSSAGSGGFHIYGIDWFDDRMEFFVDGIVYHKHYFNDGTAFPGGSADGQDEKKIVLHNGRQTTLSEYSHHFPEWKPFEHSFFIILSAGVGGSDQKTYGGAIVPEAEFPSSVYVDWVRVYQRTQ